MIGTWIVLTVVTGVVLCLGWRCYVAPYLYQMEGVEKVAFVVLAWGMGICFLGLAPSVVYGLPCALIGLGLLALGTLKGLPPILRWWYEWPVWRAVTMRSQALNEALNRVTPDRYGHIRLPEPERREEEQAA